MSAKRIGSTPLGTNIWSGSSSDHAALGIALPSLTEFLNSNGEQFAFINGKWMRTDWLSDTFNGIDIYTYGLDLRPTICLDPDATDSLRRGTDKHPYTTAADLNALITSRAGNMTGQVLGVKRGSRLLGGLNTVGVYGSSSDPFFIVPYGDAEAMPIISGGTIYANTGNPATGWAVTADKRIFKLTLATEADVFDQSHYGLIKRYWKQSTAGIGSEAAAISALIDAGVGTSIYYSGTLYVYPFAGAPDWTQVEVMNATTACVIAYADVPTTGNITFAGIHVRGARSSAFGFSAAGSSNIVTIENLSMIGYLWGQGGYDNAANNAGSDAGYAYGVSDTIRISNLLRIGGKTYDSINNSFEIAFVSSGESWGNQDFNYGNTHELWQCVSGFKVHDNYGYGRANGHVPLKAFGNSGLYQPGYNASLVTDSAKNVGNEFYRNIWLNMKDAIAGHYCGASGKFYNNTCQGKSNAGGDGYGFRVADDATSHTSGCEVKNNILVGTGVSGNCQMIVGQAATILLSAKNALYLPGGTYQNYFLGTSYTSLATFNAAAEVAGHYTFSADPQFGADGYTPANNAVFNAADTLAGYNERDWVGRPMLANGTDTAPAVGAVARP